MVASAISASRANFASGKFVIPITSKPFRRLSSDSTRAESELNRRNGFDVIGMTNLPEAKLAREAEIALATMAMITDYDCWKVEEEPVSAQTVIGHLMANAETARKVLVDLIPRVPMEPNWPEHSALDSALVTERRLWPAATVKKLEPILGRFL